MLSTRAISIRRSFVVAFLVAFVGSVALASTSDIEVVGGSHGDADVIRSYFAGTSDAEVRRAWKRSAPADASPMSASAVAVAA